MSDTPGSAPHARHFDGLTPEARPATARLEPGALVLQDADGALRRWPLDRVRVVNTTRAGVQLELAGERTEALIVADPAFAAALRAANGGRRVRGPGGGPPPARILLGLGAALVLALFLGWRWGVPALAGIAADQVPPHWERRLGAAVVQELAPPRDRVADARVTGPVGELFALLADGRESKRDSFEVIVLRAGMVNAFAAPGGYVVVTTGLLGAMRGPDELAAVLAHEISHVERRHTTRGLFARLGVRALFALIAGDQSGLGLVLDAAGTLGERSYSRADENDADAGAAELLARAGVDPAALDRALESIAGGEGGGGRLELGFLSTHPSTAGRRERVRELAARLEVAGRAELPGPAAWSAMRQGLEAGVRPSSAPR